MEHNNRKKALIIVMTLLAAATLIMCFSAAADSSAAKASEGEASAFEKAWNTFVNKFEATFITKNRWKRFADGLGTTLLITLVASLTGIVIGALTAIVRFTNAKTGRLKFLNFTANVYTTVIRGTPVAVQLLIMYFVIFASVDISKVLVAFIAFGLNSGAYVSEIIRSGLSAVDIGQLEAGRSLGFGYGKTMQYIIIPQALKNILPALGNEFIVLLKETSVAGYIALTDLTRVGTIIQAETYDAFMPLLAVAGIYLVLVVIFSKLVSMLERRLAKSDRG